MAQRTIYVPDGLHVAMASCKFNWSKIACAAFEMAIATQQLARDQERLAEAEKELHAVIGKEEVDPHDLGGS